MEIIDHPIYLPLYAAFQVPVSSDDGLDPLLHRVHPDVYYKTTKRSVDFDDYTFGNSPLIS